MTVGVGYPHRCVLPSPWLMWGAAFWQVLWETSPEAGAAGSADNPPEMCSFSRALMTDLCFTLSNSDHWEGIHHWAWTSAVVFSWSLQFLLYYISNIYFKGELFFLLYFLLIEAIHHRIPWQEVHPDLKLDIMQRHWCNGIKSICQANWVCNMVGKDMPCSQGCEYQNWEVFFSIRGSCWFLTQE